MNQAFPQDAPLKEQMQDVDQQIHHLDKA
jgi:hypothetical protein